MPAGGGPRIECPAGLPADVVPAAEALDTLLLAALDANLGAWSDAL